MKLERLVQRFGTSTSAFLSQNGDFDFERYSRPVPYVSLPPESGPSKFSRDDVSWGEMFKKQPRAGSDAEKSMNELPEVHVELRVDDDMTYLMRTVPRIAAILATLTGRSLETEQPR